MRKERGHVGWAFVGHIPEWAILIMYVGNLGYVGLIVN
jgi:hypothetical protein